MDDITTEITTTISYIDLIVKKTLLPRLHPDCFGNKIVRVLFSYDVDIRFNHYSDSQWPARRHNSPAFRLFVQQFAWTDIKGNIKVQHHCHSVNRWSSQRFSNAESVSISWHHHETPLLVLPGGDGKWWHHDMETLSVLLRLCYVRVRMPRGDTTTKGPVMRNFVQFSLLLAEQPGCQGLKKPPMRCHTGMI